MVFASIARDGAATLPDWHNDAQMHAADMCGIEDSAHKISIHYNLFVITSIDIYDLLLEKNFIDL